MARLILFCPYLKPDSTTDRGGLVRYIATRDGAERVGVPIPAGAMDKPATSKQRQLIDELLAAYPDTRDLFEYEDFARCPTVGNASETITAALENNMPAAAGRDRFVGYISRRPGAERTGSHGLFGAAGGPADLARVADEVANHPGNVWTPILSLRREDAERLGYANAEILLPEQKDWNDVLKGGDEQAVQSCVSQQAAPMMRME